jgi:hypothetical protein
MVEAITINPPLLVWTGQFLVPLQHLAGSIEAALLLSNLVFAAGTLAFVYFCARRIGASPLITLLACGSAGAFIALSHHCLAELGQTFCAAAVMASVVAAPTQSWLRALSLNAITASLGLLSKASSIIFILPLLAYGSVGVATRGVSKRLALSDYALVLLATTAVTATVSWYVVNWEPMSTHFKAATVAETTLAWGSPVYLPTKLRFWISQLGMAFSPYRAISIGALITAIAAITASLCRLTRTRPRQWLIEATESGLLFVLALAGIVCLTLLAYSLQINEDTRFVTFLVPIAALIFGWSTAQLPYVAALAFIVLAYNAAINHASAFGIMNFRSFMYMTPLHYSDAEKAQLTETVQSVCSSESAGRWNVLLVNYADLNMNTANFYAEKVGSRCRFTNLDNSGALDDRIQQLLAINPLYVLSITVEAQQPPEWFNRLAAPLTLWVQASPLFVLLSESENHRLIYRSKR